MKVKNLLFAIIAFLVMAVPVGASAQAEAYFLTTFKLHKGVFKNDYQPDKVIALTPTSDGKYEAL